MTKDLFTEVTFDILDEIKIGTGVNIRLIQSHKTKSLAIQSWGSMQGVWVTTQRYGDIRAIWERWKRLEKNISSQPKKAPKRKKVVDK